MKEILIVLCTPDMHRPAAKRGLHALKQTDLTRAELLIQDNAYHDRFHHAAVMDDMLAYAAGRSVVFMDDDVVVRDREWIRKLTDAAATADAAVTGCLHTFAGGEPQHAGILVYEDATTELLRTPPDAGSIYTPAVSSALVLVRNRDGLRFDRQFEKYQHDVDLCLEAWANGRFVACATDLVVVHEQAEYMRQKPEFREVLSRDVDRLREKWAAFARSALYARRELAAFVRLAAQTNWERRYNEASRLTSHDPDGSASLFRRLIDECPHAWHRAGAYFHLYRMERRPELLEACVRENPHHVKAVDLLRELTIREELQ